MNHKLGLGIAGGALALVIAGGAVYAAPSVESRLGATVAQAQPAPTAAPNAPAAPTAPKQLPQGKGEFKGRFSSAGALIRITADVTGLTPREVATQLSAGKSLAQIAQSKGKTADDLIKAARTKLQTQLDQAVTNGRLTKEREDALLARFDQEAPTIVNSTNLRQDLGGRGGRGQHANGRAALIQATAEVTGLTPQQVRAELQAGKSLAQIAQSKGKTADDILAKLRELGQQRLDKAIDEAKQLINQPGLK